MRLVTRQSCHFPVIWPCSRWCIALWTLDCCSYIIYKKRQYTFSLIAVRLLSKQGNGGKKRTKGVMVPSDFHSSSVYYWGRISRTRVKITLVVLIYLWLTLWAVVIVRATLSSLEKNTCFKGFVWPVVNEGFAASLILLNGVFSASMPN